MDKATMRALELDGEKLRAMTGQDHGPWDIPDTEARGGTRPLAAAGHGDGSTPSRFHPNPLDVCECGETRDQHPDGGPSRLNGLAGPERDCPGFRFAHYFNSTTSE